MRMTVELDNKILDELIESHRLSRKIVLPVAFAVRDFVNRKKAKDFGRMLREGKFDYPATNKEVESRDI